MAIAVAIRATDAVPQLGKLLRECGETGSSLRIVRSLVHEHADVPHALALLRTRQRPRGCAADERDELAPSHASDALGPMFNNSG